MRATNVVAFGRSAWRPKRDKPRRVRAANRAKNAANNDAFGWQHDNMGTANSFGRAAWPHNRCSAGMAVMARESREVSRQRRRSKVIVGWLLPRRETKDLLQTKQETLLEINRLNGECKDTYMHVKRKRINAKQIKHINVKK